MKPGYKHRNRTGTGPEQRGVRMAVDKEMQGEADAVNAGMSSVMRPDIAR